MLATFLSASVPLTKSFRIENNEIFKIGHPRIIDYTSFEEQYETIEDLYELIVSHADKGHCFLKGQLSRQLVDEPRAGTTNSNASTRILLLDFDGIKGVKNVDELLKLLGILGIDYIIQYSSSMGVLPDRGLSAHIFILLNGEYAPSILKQYLISANITIKALRSNIGLTRTNNALRWPLDITTCQNDKLIYIAPPILGEGVVDFFEGERIQLVKREDRELPLPNSIPSAEANKIASEVVLNALRKEAGLPDRKKISFKTEGNVEYMAKPDQAIVTGIKKERGFIYLNINGGDSWGYYHGDGNPEFIHNFKSEPIYKTSELLPDYWRDISKERNEPRIDRTSGIIHLAFRDFKTAAYWNGSFDTKTNYLNIGPAKSKEQLRDFLRERGVPIPDYISDWTIAFDPLSNKVVDIEGRKINLFQPTEFMKLEPKKVYEVPKVIRKVILHALGSDEECFEHMMNWLAVIIQYRCKAETCWLLHGIPGTGKGQFLGRILRRIFGYVVAKRTRELDSQFNDYLEKCMILWIDEAEIALHAGANQIEGDLKNYITEPIISIRKMFVGAYEAKNYMNVILASNHGQIIHIDPKDRRYNVAVFQDKKLITSTPELESIEDELPNFYHYLNTRIADREVARTALNNAAKQRMVDIGTTAIDVAAAALLEGNFEFFEEQCPSDHLLKGNQSRDILAGSYIRLIDEIKKNNADTLTREEVNLLLEFTIGGMPVSPHKFTSLMKHHKIYFEPINKSGKTVRGIKVKWQQ